MPVKIIKGSKYYDVCYFADPFNFSISEKLKNIFTDSGFTGWDTYPLEIEASTEKYYGFKVLGKCGPLKRPAKPGWVIGSEFDLKTWDGSDFFVLRKHSIPFLQKKSKMLLKKIKLQTLVYFERMIINGIAPDTTKCNYADL